MQKTSYCCPCRSKAASPVTTIAINLINEYQLNIIDIRHSLIEMWKCSLQQVGHELLDISHVLYGSNVRSQWHGYPVHFHQTEHVCQDGCMHHQTYTATNRSCQTIIS